MPRRGRAARLLAQGVRRAVDDAAMEGLKFPALLSPDLAAGVLGERTTDDGGALAAWTRHPLWRGDAGRSRPSSCVVTMFPSRRAIFGPPLDPLGCPHREPPSHTFGSLMACGTRLTVGSRRGL